MLQILWTTRADSDLQEIIAYISQDSPSAAQALKDKIESSVVPAGQFPYMFRAGRLSGTREVVAHPNYIVVYRVTTTHIQVESIVHSSQQYPPKKRRK